MVAVVTTAAVTRLRHTDGPLDIYGAATPGTPDELVIQGCFVAPKAVGEDLDGGREGVRYEYDLYLPHGADVLATDQVRIGGYIYSVDGPPQSWAHPFGSTAGTVAQIWRAEG